MDRRILNFLWEECQYLVTPRARDVCVNLRKQFKINKKPS